MVDYIERYLTVVDYTWLYKTIPDYIVYLTTSEFKKLYLTILEYTRLHRTIPDYNGLQCILLGYARQNGQYCLFRTIPGYLN